MNGTADLFSGVIGADVQGFDLPCVGRPITSRMAMICGTSTCHMAVSAFRAACFIFFLKSVAFLIHAPCVVHCQISDQPLFVPGVWGPYLSAMVPGLWLNEGGQSATGTLVRLSNRSWEQIRTLLIWNICFMLACWEKQTLPRKPHTYPHPKGPKITYRHTHHIR